MENYNIKMYQPNNEEIQNMIGSFIVSLKKETMEEYMRELLEVNSNIESNMEIDEYTFNDIENPIFIDTKEEIAVWAIQNLAEPERVESNGAVICDWTILATSYGTYKITWNLEGLKMSLYDEYVEYNQLIMNPFHFVEDTIYKLDDPLFEGLVEITPSIEEIDNYLENYDENENSLDM